MDTTEESSSAPTGGDEVHIKPPLHSQRELADLAVVEPPAVTSGEIEDGIVAQVATSTTLLLPDLSQSSDVSPSPASVLQSVPNGTLLQPSPVRSMPLQLSPIEIAKPAVPEGHYQAIIESGIEQNVASSEEQPRSSTPDMLLSLKDSPGSGSGRSPSKSGIADLSLPRQASKNASEQPSASGTSSHHHMHSLDAVWREPLILPPLRKRTGSVSARNTFGSAHKLREDQDQDQSTDVDRSFTASAVRTVHDLGSGSKSTIVKEASQQNGTEKPRILQDSSKANVLNESLGSSPAAGKPTSEEHSQPDNVTDGRITKSVSEPVKGDKEVETVSLAPFSLWEYLKEEVLATDVDSTQEMRWDRVSNFMAVPWQCEKMILFGFVICLDSFLYTFTILPLRFAVALCLWCRNIYLNLSGSSKGYISLHSSHKCDLLKTALIVISCYILSRVTDASKMYHSVRGQETIKLYVIFNVLEIVDRLCCSLGQDLLDALFSRRTLGRQSNGRQPLLRPLHLFILALVYIQIHTVVLFYQLVTLNVAINSYDNALLTLLLSNQFVEIKGSVFKKFEKENLFQMTCADIVERFQLTLILSAIGVRNLIEVTSGGDSVSQSTAARPRGPLGEMPLPRSFTVLPSLSVLATSFAPVVIVLGSECVVDWLKHAFITKFNHIRPSVYGRFMDVLCRDLVLAGPGSGSADVKQRGGDLSDKSAKNPAQARASSWTKRRNTFVDQSPILSRRLGFAALPLACLLARISVQIYGMLGDDSHFDECAIPPSSDGGAQTGLISTRWFPLLRYLSSGLAPLFSFSPGSSVQILAWLLPLILCWVFLIAVKVLLGTALISFAHHRYESMASREQEEELNDRSRPHIGVDRVEAEYERKVKEVLGHEPAGHSSSGSNGVHPLPHRGAGSSAGGSSLINVNRYTMVKSRLW